MYNIGRAYGTGFIGIRVSYPGVKTAGLQYVSCLRHSFLHEASSVGTNDIVAMEFIPLERKIDIVAMEFIPLERKIDIVAMEFIQLERTIDIVAMEFIQLERKIDVVAMEFIPLQRTNNIVAIKGIPFQTMIRIQSSIQIIINFLKLKLWKIIYRKEHRIYLNRFVRSMKMGMSTGVPVI